MDSEIWIMENAGYIVDYKTNKPIIMLFSRNYKDKYKTITHKVYGFEPYFYCPANETDKEDPDRYKLPPKCRYDDEIVIDALGREVRKVIVDIPNRVRDIRDNYSFTDMSDFLFEKRFLVDYKIKYAYTWDEFNNRPTPVEVEGILEPRIVYYDIENLSKDGGFPGAEEAKYPVCMIQVKDSYTKKHFLFTSGVPQTKFEGHIACKNESELFKVFLEYIKDINPDVISGWWSSGYDLPYLIKRAYNLGLNFNGFGRINRPFRNFDIKKNEWRSKAPGRSTLDMKEAFKKKTAVDAQRETYALKSISALYGFEYKDFGPTINKLFEDEDWETLLQYGLNDVLALELIDEKAGLFSFFEGLRKFTGCFLDDVLHTSLPIESILLHKNIKPMPRKSIFVESDKSKFEGAIVHKPPAGIHHNVITIDIAALYPNVLYGYSLSPDVDGLVPNTLREIMDERERLRALKKLNPSDINIFYEETAIKIVANAFFGTIGSKSFRLFNEEIAGTITRKGREINLMLKEYAEKLNLNVIAGDTDSLFLTEVKTIDEGLEYEKLFNDFLEKFSIETKSKVIFKLKFEKFFRTLMFKFKKDGEPAKKKYIGNLIWEEGKDCNELYDKGTELTRSDNSKITKEILETFMDLLLMKDDSENAKKYIKESYDRVKNGNVDVFEISIPKEVRKANASGPWQEGKDNTIKYLNHHITEGEKPRLIYVTKEPYKLCIDEDLDIGEWKNYIDWKLTLEKTVTDKLKTYVEAAGMDWDAIVHGQKSLTDFFS